MLTGAAHPYTKAFMFKLASIDLQNLLKNIMQRAKTARLHLGKVNYAGNTAQTVNQLMFYAFIVAVTANGKMIKIIADFYARIDLQ